MSGGRIINTLPEALVALDRSAKELEALKDTLGKLPAGDGKDQLIAAANLKALELTDLSAVLGMGTTHLSAKNKEDARAAGVRARGQDPGASPVIPAVNVPKLVEDAKKALTEASQLQRAITFTAIRAGVGIPIAPAAAPGVAPINKTDDHVGVRGAVAHRPRAGSFSARTRPVAQPGAQAGGQPAAGAQAGGQPAGAQAGGQPAGAQAGGQPAGAQAGGAQAGGQPAGAQAGGAQAGGQPAGAQAGGQPAGAQAGGQPAGAQAGGQPAGAQAGGQPAGAQAGGQPAGAQAGGQPAGAQAGGQPAGAQAGGQPAGAQAGGQPAGAQAGGQPAGAQAGGQPAGAQAGGQPAGAQAGGQPAGAQAGAQPYAGTFDDLSNVHADLDKYRQAIKLYAAHIKLAIRSAHQRASFNKKRQEIETDLKTMQTLLSFYHNHPPVKGKEDVSSEINDLTQVLADLQKVKNTPQDKIMVGRGALKAEFITDTLENARAQLTTKMMTAAIVPGLSGGISREINADFSKPYASVYAINTPAGEVRTGVLQHYDATSKRLVTEYQLEKDHQTKMAQITRNSKKTGMLSSIDIPGDAILKDVYAKVALHIANPNTTQPILFNGIGLHPDEIEMHFIAFKMLNVKCDSYSEVLCGFDPAKIKQEHVDFANERMASSLTPGEDFTTQQQKDIPDQLHASFSNQPTKPVI